MRRCVLLIATLMAVPVAAAAQGTVRVLYAGSLVNLMEHGIGPGFDQTGSSFEGFAAGSGALVNQIKGRLRTADVFISANPALNGKLVGPANGNWVSWFVAFAQSPLVIGYNPGSRFASDLKTKPWYEVLQEPGIRIGRTDPVLDPKGALTLKLVAHAGQVTKSPALSQKILGAPDNPAQVLPEETLAGRLQSGQLDAGFFYSTETADLHIPSVALPPEMALSARYTLTILRGAPNPAGAAAFAAFLLGPQGRAIMHLHGLDVVPAVAAGDVASIPAPITAELDQAR